ncbi:UPF0271 protein [Alicycliphilus denitrificans]|uniref:LamB/YcsF family protein n=1 Tax=Alicycliphilus denitrificans TaxID=179636 RepID=UPI00095BA08E|nr:5-oxoprolinase subunit PxpA [Alicycliphilus denitrificans]MBN9572435.1 5-oxoprolinase subunit PxpA [Alicycliphilus denitrificans]OJW91536.1 MAG: hypothetical protein BGO66_14990 [Alicycliphilus sp. 69-12]BCN37803.1 UPF0271 protein [Alicycliphilus denitrificans]
MTTVDINCDLGEGFGPYRMGDDAALMKVITSANIACGFHAGDPGIMVKTVQLAMENGVDIGAHVGFADLQGFGRRVLNLEPAELKAMTWYQLGALQGIAQAAGRRLQHVTFHGALGNMCFADADLAATLMAAIKAFDAGLTVIAPPMTEMEKAAEQAGLPVKRVVFADRAYDDRGLLVSRKLPGAVIHDPEAVIQRVLGMVQDGAITSQSGKRMPLAIDSVLVHGDTPGSASLASLVRERLQHAGVQVRPLSQR